MNVNRHFLIWLLFFSSTVYGTAQESTVLNFDNTFILKFSLRYNFLQLSLDGSPNDKITSNRPMDLEIGFGYKDLFLGVSINIPFLYDTDILRSLSFDFGFNYFYKNILYLDFFLKVYEHFHTEKYTTNEEELNLQLSHTGLMGEYIFNPDHSIRSIYNLDRKQLISNGSFLIGGGVFYSSVYSKDDALYGYSNKENVYYVGPNAGYSYTWILNNVFFVNILTVFGITCTLNNGNIYFGFQILPKFSFGCHIGTWSMNMIINNNSLIYLQENKFRYIISSGAFTITFVKRFGS